MDLSSLTPAQVQAVRHRGGPLLVLAGPGTGKTRTLTYRLAQLIAEGTATPDHFLSITFTNKAADEIRSRVEPLCCQLQSPALPWITTFHGFCFRFLRDHFPCPYQLLSEPESLAFLKETVREKGRDFPSQSLKELARRISVAKNAFVPPDLSEAFSPWDLYPSWPDIYRAFQEKLFQKKRWDFDDLLYQTVTVIEGNPDLLESLPVRFPYVLVDEFQDINPVQYRLFQHLTRGNGEWMVIGDPNQAIYGFRGASAEFFSRLEADYPALTKINLKETFRLNQTILTVSSQVLNGSSQPHVLPLIALKKGEPRIPVATLSSDEEEGEFITRVIEEEMGGLSFSFQDHGSGARVTRNQTRSFSDFAVLYRLHAQGDQLAKAFLKKGIPFKKIQETHWAERPEIRICLTKLRLYSALDCSPQEALETILFRDNPFSSGLGEEEAQALKRLRLFAAQFQGTLEEFIETLSLQTGLDTFEPDQETVKLLTLHAAKGLEFQVVILSGCEGNLLPLSLLRVSDPEEERRLFYVGMTRARDRLFLTRAKTRTLFGQRLTQVPSPFLENIDKDFKNPLVFQGSKPPVKARKKQLSLF